MQISCLHTIIVRLYEKATAAAAVARKGSAVSEKREEESEM